MIREPGLRLRVFLLLLVGSVAWLLWSRSQSARVETAMLREQVAAAAQAETTAREAESHRGLLDQILERLAERASGPRSAAETRERLMAIAAPLGVEISVAHFQPLQRPPAGARGAEIRLTVVGSEERLLGFLAALESERLPIRFEQADLALPAVGPASLTASASALWSDPSSAPDPARLAADARLPALAAWLAAPLDPEQGEGIAPPPEPDEEEMDREAPAEQEAPALAESLPVLQGFLEAGEGGEVRAMFSLRGEVTMAAAGEMVGAYRVRELSPPEGAILVRPGFPPLRLTLE